MKQKLLLLMGLVLSVCFTQAQSGSIRGQVNSNGKGISRATVSLLKAKDSAFVKAEVTDGAGKYEFEQVKPGQYLVSINSLGYARYYSAAITVNPGDKIVIDPANLATIANTLQGVEVTATARKPMIEVKADKTIFNVESSINATGSNAFELLQKSPGVVTDKDDNISMRGKNGVRVFIDGRPTQLNSTDLAAYLKSINSVDIEAIETITNPSARYEAEGNAGIINIRLKKNKKFGTNGSFTTGINVGERPKTNMGLSLNNRTKKVNLFSNYSNNWGDNVNRFDLNREQSGIYNQQSNLSESVGWNQNLKAGIDVFLDKNNTLGIIGTYNVNDRDQVTRTTSTMWRQGFKDSIIYSRNEMGMNNKNFNVNLNYRYADSTGAEFELNADKGFFRGRRNSYQPNATFLPYPETLLRNEDFRAITPTDIDINTVKIDVTKPLKKGKIEAGAKFSLVNTDNSMGNFDIFGDTEIKDLTRSNAFTYRENINALYVNYLRMFNPKWTLQAGLRMENTNSEGDLVREDGTTGAEDNVKRTYTDLFPSAALTFNAAPKHAFNLTYSRRIDRPNYQDLNPFEFRLNNLSFQKGNPFLQPQYTNSVALTHTFNYRYSTSISYSRTNDFKAQWIDTLDKVKSFITQRNIATEEVFNINFSLPFQITKKWSLYANINAYRSAYQAKLGDDQNVNLSFTSGNLFAQNSFQLGDGFTGELSGFYSAPGVWGGTIKSKAMGGIDIGFQKTLFKGKGNARISYTDVLRTMRWKGESNYNGSRFDGGGRWESQQIRLNITYRFGSTQVKSARQRKSASEEESKRLQQSGGVGGN